MLTLLIWLMIPFFLIILFFGSILFANYVLPNIHYKGPISDHFDGTHFYYPGSRHRSLREVIKWYFAHHPTSWPKKVERTHHFPPPEKTYPDENPKISFIGHSSVLLQWNHLNLLIDPVYAEKVGPSYVPWLQIPRVQEPGIKFEDLPPIDVVLISHGHYDHMDIETLKRLQSFTNPLFITSLGHKKFLEREGIHNVIEMDWWEKKEINDNFHITFLPAKHASNRSLYDMDRRLWGAFGIHLKEKDYVLFGGDSAYASHWKEIKEVFGIPRVALLPIGAYKPRWFMKSVHMDPQEMLEAIHDLGNPKAMAIHFGTFDLADEGFSEPVDTLKSLIKNESVWIPKEGESREF